MNTGSEGIPERPSSAERYRAEPRATEPAASAEERIRDAAAAGKDRLRDKGEEARVTAERALDHVRQYTRDNPFAAAGIAFAAGIVLSRLLRR